uniref:Uncharacterized protein n=1 Tax=viral metagenome TaxID=1070528 RepID=A0A6M3IID3_9ZZZZ
MDIIEKLSKQAEKLKGPNVYEGIEIAEWQIIADLADSYLGETLSRIQEKVYNWYVRKLVGELRLAARANKDVNAGIYGGILEGIANASIERLSFEAGNQLENWERDNQGNKT